MRFTDRNPIGSTRVTKEGYLVATSRVARTGVQLYRASELGDVAIEAGFKPDDIVRLYRSPEEVFHEDSLATITRLPITVNHPADNVGSDNWSELSVGDVGDAYKVDGDWVVVNPMIKDSDGVEAAKRTHREISMGYTAQIIVARDGVDADFEQTNIRYNHLALVEKARAGDQARIGDSWGILPVTDNKVPSSKPKEGIMPELKTVVLGDEAVQVALSDVASIEKFKTASAKKLADAESIHAKEIIAKEEEIAKLQAELDDLKSKVLSEEELDAKVADRAELIAAATAIAPEVKCSGLKDSDIRKAVVTAKLGDAAVAGKSQAYMDARFDIMLEDSKKADPVGDVFRKGTKLGDSDSLSVSRDAYLARLTRQQKEG